MATATRINTTARTNNTAKSAPKLGGQRGTALLLAIARARQGVSKGNRADALNATLIAESATALSQSLAAFRELAKDPRQTADYLDADGMKRTASCATIAASLSGIRATTYLSGALKLAK